MKQGVSSCQDCFMLPSSIDGMFDSVVFGSDTECSAMLWTVDGLDELGTARDGLTESSKDCECSIPSGISRISSLSVDISSDKSSLNDSSSYFVRYVFRLGFSVAKFAHIQCPSELTSELLLGLSVKIWAET